MKVIGLITSFREAKEVEYIARVRTIIERVRLLAIIAKARERRGKLKL